MTAPTIRDIQQSVLHGLRMDTALTPILVPIVKFEPSIGIAATKIDLLGAKVTSFREPLTLAVKTIIAPSIRRNFDAGGRPPWEPLSEFTLKMRAKEGHPADTPLIRTGLLRRVASSLTIWEITDRSAVVADLPETAWYGKVHQAGYEGRSMRALILKHGGDVQAADEEHTANLLSGNVHQGRVTAPIPARPFLMIHEEDKVKVIKLFMKWLALKVEEAMA